MIPPLSDHLSRRSSIEKGRTFAVLLDRPQLVLQPRDIRELCCAVRIGHQDLPPSAAVEALREREREGGRDSGEKWELMYGKYRKELW